MHSSRWWDWHFGKPPYLDVMETHSFRRTMHHLHDRQAEEFLHHPQADPPPTQQQRPSLICIHILRQLFLKEETNTKCSTMSHFKEASFTTDLVMWSWIRSDDSPKTSYAEVNRITSIWHLLTKGCTDNSERNYELAWCLTMLNSLMVCLRVKWAL